MSKETARVVHEVRQAAGWTQTEMGSEFNVDQSTIYRWERGVRIRDPEKYEKLLTMHAELVHANGSTVAFSRGIPDTEQDVELIGEAGAGSRVFNIEHDSVGSSIETVRAPKAYGKVAAVKVKGESMLPRYGNGDILFVGEADENPEDLIGKECLIRTEDGGRWIKFLERGSEPGRFNLTSYNASPIRDQIVLQAKRIRHVDRA